NLREIGLIIPSNYLQKPLTFNFSVFTTAEMKRIVQLIHLRRIYGWRKTTNEVDPMMGSPLFCIQLRCLFPLQPIVQLRFNLLKGFRSDRNDVRWDSRAMNPGFYIKVA